MIKDGVEYKKCPQCKRLCLALEIKNGICKDCRIENLEKENEQLKQKIEELKKENAKLKKQCSDYEVWVNQERD